MYRGNGYVDKILEVTLPTPKISDKAWNYFFRNQFLHLFYTTVCFLASLKYVISCSLIL